MGGNKGTERLVNFERNHERSRSRLTNRIKGECDGGKNTSWLFEKVREVGFGGRRAPWVEDDSNQC